MTLSGVCAIPVPSLNTSPGALLEALYFNVPVASKPITQKTVSRTERNLFIQQRHLEGMTISDLARQFSIWAQGVWQIVNRRRD